MPYIHVTLASGRTPDAKRKLMASITEAVHETIDAPLESIRVWITEVPPEEMSTGGIPLDVIRAQRAATAAKS